MIRLAAGGPDYPSRLLDLDDAPLWLHASGPMPMVERWVGIVGSRRASERGRAMAQKMAQLLCRQGVGVVSGGALGVDAAAHRGALAGGGQTIVVLPTPVEAPEPRRNRRLFAEVVAAGGVLVSEVESGPVFQSHFMARNRIIAALSDLVVVVEAGPRSGTRYTSRAARRLGRPLAVVGWPDGDPRGAGLTHLVEAARIHVPEDVLSLVGITRAGAEDPTEDPLLAALGGEDVAVETLAARVAAPVRAVLVRLTALEISGRIQLLPGGRVRRR